MSSRMCRYRSKLDKRLVSVDELEGKVTYPLSQPFYLTQSSYSGKSSMVSSLFRMVDIHDGRILVDGLDISTIPREEIRTKLVGVPQDAFLIEGSSVRLNTDPAEGLTDAAIEDALKAVELWDIVIKKGGLDVPIEELHLSHGQKQLFCIARAMIRPSPIVILDEATSRYAFMFSIY